MLVVLRSAEFCESAPAQVWARLLDRGVYLCSIATMHRILPAVNEVGDRRRQRTHPATKKPELCARRPLEVWSWDITKLRTNTRGEYFELYVIIDIYSRFVVGWTVAEHETGRHAKNFIARTYRQHDVKPGQLTLHSDRGASMTSKTVAQLFVDLGVDRSHNRPHTSNDNPYSEAAFKTLKYCPAFPTASTASITPAGSAPNFSSTTTISTTTPALPCSPRQPFTTGACEMFKPPAPACSTAPTRRTPNDSHGDHDHYACQAEHGSTTPPKKPKSEPAKRSHWSQIP